MEGTILKKPSAQLWLETQKTPAQVKAQKAKTAIGSSKTVIAMNPLSAQQIRSNGRAPFSQLILLYGSIGT
jgi:hypothetical protein